MNRFCQDEQTKNGMPTDLRLAEFDTAYHSHIFKNGLFNSALHDITVPNSCNTTVAKEVECRCWQEKGL